ncbi:MAG: hypothetical protein AB1758_15080 [Candidatus Eremiobacterota bacterium]
MIPQSNLFSPRGAGRLTRPQPAGMHDDDYMAPKRYMVRNGEHGNYTYEVRNSVKPGDTVAHGDFERRVEAGYQGEDVVRWVPVGEVTVEVIPWPIERF